MSNQSFFPPTLHFSVTVIPNVFRRRFLVRVLLSGILFFLARQIYLNTTITITPTHNSSITRTHNSWELEIDNHLVNSYSTVFQDLIHDGFLTVDSKTLAVGIQFLEFTDALTKAGVTNPKSTKKNVWLPYRNSTFDFQFSSHTGLDCSPNPHDFSSELSRTLKPDGYLVIHTESKDSYSLNSLLSLFDSFKLIRSREMCNTGSCSVPAYKKKLIQTSEVLIYEEPFHAWIEFKKNLKNMKYLPSMKDIRFKTGYVYVDVGARRYGSSIGSWFKKFYTRQDKEFKIFAVEADKQFHAEYKSKKKVTLLPYAAWVRNESLFFEINRAPNYYDEEKGIRGMGRVQSAHTSTSFMGV
ncbi:hypothetical protein L1987_13354 [Smallanthus sonchifolius]|uniref:Uncharacterized protein n=1 Tax=Smallanthus sonchifolius TaxID=185202 RepID=A0ACB9JH46_9ASTR|nr:hypothetical protein L1987_13354 [Smallanthus sonchifolius]